MPGAWTCSPSSGRRRHFTSRLATIFRQLSCPSSHWIANPVTQAGSLDLQSKFWTEFHHPMPQFCLGRAAAPVHAAVMLVAYAAALLMGLTLGMIGAGGSILTVPILVYLFGVDPILATAYSLFVVGTTALVGAIAYARSGLIDYRAAMQFGIPSVVAVFAVRLWLVPNLPNQILGLPNGTFVLVVFAFVMLAASVSMIRPKKEASPEAEETGRGPQVTVAIAEGIIVGAVTGFVGAGGGFLIVPALVYFLRLPMRRAIGTSLFVIAGKSLIGFCADAGGPQLIDWRFLMAFAAVSSLGIALGVRLGTKLPAARLRFSFGWFVLITGIAIILVELF